MVDSTESTDPHNQEHLISDYLNNHLDPEERLAFERLLTSDPLLADELKLQKELAEAIRRMEREELKQRIVEINNDYELEFEEYSQMTYAAASAKHYSKQKTAVKPKIRYVYSIAAILTIVLISSVIVYFQIHQKSTSKNSLAEEKSPTDTTTNNNSISKSTPNPTAITKQEIHQEYWIERLNSDLVAKTELTVNAFSFSTSGFGFAANNQKLLTTIYTKRSTYSSLENQNTYVLTTKTLSLFTGKRQKIRLYNISNLDIDDAAIELQPGYYIYLDDTIYYLLNDSIEHQLTPLNQSDQGYLKKHLQ